jgi:hypothetical protein
MQNPAPKPTRDRRAEEMLASLSYAGAILAELEAATPIGDLMAAWVEQVEAALVAARLDAQATLWHRLSTQNLDNREQSGLLDELRTLLGRWSQDLAASTIPRSSDSDTLAPLTLPR